MKFVVLLLQLLVGVFALERVNDYTFDKIVRKSGDFVLVDFYADWCRHCQKLMPTVEQLSEEYKTIDGINIVKHNGGERSGRKMVKKYEIDGFPMLALFHGDDKPIFYEGGRDFESINNFLKLSTGIQAVDNPEIKPFDPKESGVSIGSTRLLSINDNNLIDKVLTSSKKTLLLVSGEWCKFCKQVKPIFQALPDIYQLDEKVQFGIVNIDNEHHTTDKIKAQFGIESIPEILLFDTDNVDQDGLRRPIKFKGQKTLKGLISFINDNLLLKRLDSGRLDSSAGRLSHIDSMIDGLLYIDHEGEQKVYVDAGYKISEALNQHLETNPSQEYEVKYYHKVIGKILEDDKEFISRELQRLSKLSENKNVRSTQLDLIDTRINILKAFSTFIKKT